MKRIYLDFAAGAPVLPSARKAFLKALEAFGNPSAAHAEARAAKAVLEEARTSIAHQAGAKPENLIFTSGATEANALAIRGHLRACIKEGKKPSELHVLYLPGAHASLENALQALALEGVNIEPLPLKDGALDLTALPGKLRPETTLVTTELISAETGARFDTKGLRHVLDKAGTRIALHVDASQAPFVESFDRTRLGADLLTLDAQKVGGVRGIGCLVFSSGIPLAAVIEGGSQERGLRPGTEAQASAAAFAAALTEAEEGREKFVASADILRTKLIERVQAAIPDAFINEGVKQAPHILNVSFPGRDTDYLAALLDKEGFAVSTKSACETDSPNGSRAVFAQTGDTLRAASTLRVSWGPSVKEADLMYFAKALITAVGFIDRNRL